MAGAPSETSPPSLYSATNSDNSAPPLTSHSLTSLQVDARDSNIDEKKPDLPSLFHDPFTAERVEKFRKYEGDYTCWLRGKYFSKTDLYGGNIFDEHMSIDGKVIKASRWPCYRSYADPVQGFEDHNNESSTGITGNPSNISNGKLPVKKNGL